VNYFPLKTKILTKRQEIRFGMFAFLPEMKQFRTTYAKWALHCLFYFCEISMITKLKHRIGCCVCVCVWLSQQMLPTARKTVATVCSNEQCFVIIIVNTLHKDQSASSFVWMTNKLLFAVFCIRLTARYMI
jgi:hypothetical protein